MKVRNFPADAFVMAALLCVASGVSAQTATPTTTSVPTATATCTPLPTAPPCAGTKRVQISWASKNPSQVNVSVSATKCDVPASCGASPQSGVQTVAPVTLIVSDAACHTLTTTFATPAVNFTGCPGGKDAYIGALGKLKLIYGVGATALGFMKLPFPQSSTTQPTPPAFMGPLQFSITDAAGYSVGGTVSTCFTHQTATSWRLKCF